MSSNSFGDNFRITTFGESHGPALGVVIDGIQPGISVDLDSIQADLDRRRPGTSALSSPRKEGDQLEVLSGVFEGRTTGAPIALMIRNKDARSQHYAEWKDIFRPGHADFTWWKKFGIRDWRGGGRTSGRETAVRVAAGSLASQLLQQVGVRIYAHVVRIGDEVASAFDPTLIEKNEARCADAQAAERMVRAVKAASKAGDSLGGIVEVIAEGVPAGWGDPVFQKLDAQLAAALISIGAVKGVEIGDGFTLAARRGSETNDRIRPHGFMTNRMGGILGGISNGETIVARIAVKPTSSIRIEQETTDIHGQERTIRVPGRHDPCICPRIVPVAEAMMALVLCDAYLRQQAISAAKTNPHDLGVELDFCDAELLRLLKRRDQILSGSSATTPISSGSKPIALRPATADMARQLGISEDRARRLLRAWVPANTNE